MRTVLLIGRWQPFHDGHAALVRYAIDEGAAVVVGVRVASTPDEDNPFNYEERKAAILDRFPGADLAVIPIPDRDTELEVWVGRKVGYKVMRLPDSVEMISGTNIRKSLGKSLKETLMKWGEL